MIDAIIELAEKCAKEPWALPETPPEISAAAAKLREPVRSRCCARPIGETVKQARHEQDRRGQERRPSKHWPGEASRAPSRSAASSSDLEKRHRARRYPRDRPPHRRPRHQDRASDHGEVGVLPRAHGSALFTRGETQALVVATLGTGQDEQIIDALEGEYREHFMLHYNFPPYSVGEVGPHGLARPARDRPRQAGLARDPPAAAGQGRLPLHDPRRLGDHRVATARRRWRRSAAARCR